MLGLFVIYDVGLVQREEIYLAEQFAEREGHRGIHFFSMHPGWADTPGVQTSLPDFHVRFKESLRSMDEGADTINYLAISDALIPAAKEAEQGGGYNGRFFFDREAVTPFLLSTRTHSTDEEVEELWQLCSRMTQLHQEAA